MHDRIEYSGIVPMTSKNSSKCLGTKSYKVMNTCPFRPLVVRYTEIFEPFVQYGSVFVN